MAMGLAFNEKAERRDRMVIWIVPQEMKSVKLDFKVSKKKKACQNKTLLFYVSRFRGRFGRSVAGFLSEIRVQKLKCSSAFTVKFGNCYAEANAGDATHNALSHDADDISRPRGIQKALTRHRHLLIKDFQRLDYQPFPHPDHSPHFGH